jgi:molecular chaperone Hsp33
VSFLVSGTAAGVSLRVFAADTTSVVSEARARHGLSPTATAALGRSMTGALLLAQVLSKTPEAHVTVRVQGDGPIGYIVAEGGRDGSMRGYVKYPEADLPPRVSDGKLDVGGLVGTDGDIAVMRVLENAEPYIGSVPLVSGEIADDLATYLYQSEQIPSALLLGVHLDSSGVTHAGGLLIQAMPGTSDETLGKLEENIRVMGQITTVMRSEGILGVVTRATLGLDYLGDEDAMNVRFQCRCSLERARSSLVYFSKDERQEMIEQGGQEVICHWCDEHHLVTPELIRSLDEQAA